MKVNPHIIQIFRSYHAMNTLLSYKICSVK